MLENGMWSAPQNLGYPINTPADELYYKLLPDGFRAYMASTRDEGSAGDFDIYMITFLGDEKQLMPVYDVEPLALTLENFQPLAPEGMIKLKTLKQTIVKGTILDDFSSEPISSMIEITDNKTNTLIDTIKTPASGNYMISLPSGRN
ncbi:MAG: hypothetical protein PHN94_09315, partial [Bacteroidales bacterium]|nr:hypothetical protein [Bacteroidales bacterium]